MAVAALKPSGGILHLHENVSDSREAADVTAVLDGLDAGATQAGRPSLFRVLRLERVKWYAPHIRHIVLDIECLPKTNQPSPSADPSASMAQMHGPDAAAHSSTTSWSPEIPGKGEPQSPSSIQGSSTSGTPESSDHGQSASSPAEPGPGPVAAGTKWSADDASTRNASTVHVRNTLGADCDQPGGLVPPHQDAHSNATARHRQRRTAALNGVSDGQRRQGIGPGHKTGHGSALSSVKGARLL